MDLLVISGKYREWKEQYSTKAKRIREFTQLASTPIPEPLIGGIILILGIVTYGLILVNHDLEAFKIWIREDGLAEWLTFVELLMMSAYSFVVTAHFGHSEEERGARRVWLFLGFLFLFGAMEEISWGQRILGLETPEWFIKHNAQGEINIHNLVIGGIKLNKLVFGKILAVLLVVYVLGIRLLYHISQRARGAVNQWRIPVAQNYQILLFVAVTIVVRLHMGLSKRVGELVELSHCFFLFLILLHPFNPEIFPWKGLGGILRQGIFSTQKRRLKG